MRFDVATLGFREAAKAVALCMLVCVAAAVRAAVPDGAAVYSKHCAQCHDPGAGHPGTMMLREKYGEARAVLRERTDLAPAYVSMTVRRGLREMPAFRPSEIDDAELDALGRFLAPAEPVQ